jgi:exocyst complex component 4
MTSKIEGAFILAPSAGRPGQPAGLTGQTNLFNASQLRLAALESPAKHADVETLKDLFWTLYSKLDAVCQGLRVVSEVSNRIGSRREFKDASGTKLGALFPISEIWVAVQAEIRGLLHDYLTSEEQSIVARNPISSINEILRENKFSRDKSKNVFRFSDTDVKFATKTLKIHETELMRVLKETMPGLVQGSSESPNQNTLFSVGSDDRGVGQHHRLLIKPDAFHVNVLFQPTLSFLHRVIIIFPSGNDFASAGRDILDEFVSKVYLPQLEEKVSSLFHDAVSGSTSFFFFFCLRT